ncbi:hypothetical protein TBLA_0B03760 [Henningerozyma blattae CBS 6284]|uniref:Translation machinery-associated protein 16 n=1 Tax=Henningerozyma blattae (strain ATCC 34711 / CBS 6284 / DSM 70876 / NBRC 10599 / NRRL Y-10934 / UCD 77-7) TaxID=1071380 RepID=I2GYL3_HENB6|nr:hypothetical protein TBLA_0B03760 [Tetrapisispora blattae CBS 6284]CCH59215.1 hypothetical protein TBLA_0B03760 [Tetrapisispora blattae CBS 6284]
MPVSKSLAKIKKNLKSGTKKATIHPKGRKFQQLTRATLRDEKIAAKKKAHNERKSNELARVKFIQDIINSDSFKEQMTFSLKELSIFIQQFIDRDDDELNELKKKRRSNRPPTNRQLLLDHKKSLEMEEFKKGFLCPDLLDEKNVEFLRGWNLSFGGMSTLKLIRVDSQGNQTLINEVNTADVDME